MPDFVNLIKQFKDTFDTEFISLVSNIAIDHDKHLYSIETNQGILDVYEIDYIGDFEEDVFKPVKNEIGEIEKVFEVKEIMDFEKTGPFLASLAYKKPPEWEHISKFANDKFGSKRYYFNFLIKKKD